MPIIVHTGIDSGGGRNDGDVVLYALHAARVTSRPAERRVGTRLAGRARRDACLCLPASLPALDARRRDAQRRRRSRASAESHELRREPAVARSPSRRKGCSMRESMQHSTMMHLELLAMLLLHLIDSQPQFFSILILSTLGFFPWNCRHILVQFSIITCFLHFITIFCFIFICTIFLSAKDIRKCDWKE